MANYKLTNAEKETIILWNEDDDPIIIDTFDRRMIDRLKKLSTSYPEDFQLKGPDRFGGYSAKVAKQYVRVSLLSPTDEEQRTALSENAKRTNRITNLKNPK